MAANPSVDQLIASTNRFYANNKYEDQVYNGRPTIAWLKANGGVKEYSGGNPIYEPLREGQNSTLVVAGNYDEFNFTPQDNFGLAQFTPKMFHLTTVLDWATKWDNSGSVRVIDLWQEKVNETIERAQDYLNNIIITGDGSDPLALVGFPVMIATTGTYGNITRSGNTFWQSYVNSDAVPLSEDHIRTGANTVSRNKKGNGPNLHLTTQTLYEKYESLITPSLRTDMAHKGMADLGFNSLSWNGKPVIYDDAVGTGLWYFLNTKYFSVRPHSQANFMRTDRVHPMKQPVDGMVTLWRGAITCRGCRYLGKLSGKTA